MENTDITNIKETFDAWIKEFLESEQAASLTDFQREQLIPMVDSLVTVATYDGWAPTDWTPIVVTDMVVNSVCKIHPLGQEVLAIYPTTMAAFFTFLSAKDYLSNGKEIGAALIEAKADIKQSDEDTQKLEVIQMLMEEANEEGIGLTDTDELLDFMKKRSKEQEVINLFHDKSDAGIPIDEIMDAMTTEEQEIVMKYMSKKMPTDYDPVKGKKGMKMVEAAMARGKSIEEATAALPDDLMQHVLGYMGTMTESQGGGGGYVEPVQPIRSEPKIGRNDPCSCGSGKKYKRCCLRKR